MSRARLTEDQRIERRYARRYGQDAVDHLAQVAIWAGHAAMYERLAERTTEPEVQALLTEAAQGRQAMFDVYVRMAVAAATRAAHCARLGGVLDTGDSDTFRDPFPQTPRKAK